MVVYISNKYIRNKSQKCSGKESEKIVHTLHHVIVHSNSTNRVKGTEFQQKLLPSLTKTFTRRIEFPITVIKPAYITDNYRCPADQWIRSNGSNGHRYQMAPTIFLVCGAAMPSMLCAEKPTEPGKLHLMRWIRGV